MRLLTTLNISSLNKERTRKITKSNENCIQTDIKADKCKQKNIRDAICHIYDYMYTYIIYILLYTTTSYNADCQ